MNAGLGWEGFLTQRLDSQLSLLVVWGQVELENMLIKLAQGLLQLQSSLQLKGQTLLFRSQNRAHTATALRDEKVTKQGPDHGIPQLKHRQFANYMLQLSQLTFTCIGAISKDHASNTWSVTGRPLSYNMNELATVAGYPDN
jgi:hypothetical protein